MSTNWSEWHDAYARPGSGLGDRLAEVSAQIERRLDATAPDPVRVVSACAGDGRDLLGVLSRRTDADRVTALLVEYDAGLAARARETADALTATVEVRQADAAQSDVYAHAVPADLVLLCGIFGNISDADVRATVEAAPQLCAPRAEVVWTRHRHDADLTPSIRSWFADSGFEEVAFIAPEREHWSVRPSARRRPSPSRARPPLVHVLPVTERRSRRRRLKRRDDSHSPLQEGCADTRRWV